LCGLGIRSLARASQGAVADGTELVDPEGTVDLAQRGFVQRKLVLELNYQADQVE
jgi:hypothetical protein